jgi:hypothetical protein
MHGAATSGAWGDVVSELAGTGLNEMTNSGGLCSVQRKRGQRRCVEILSCCIPLLALTSIDVWSFVYPGWSCSNWRIFVFYFDSDYDALVSPLVLFNISSFLFWIRFRFSLLCIARRWFSSSEGKVRRRQGGDGDGADGRRTDRRRTGSGGRGRQRRNPMTCGPTCQDRQKIGRSNPCFNIIYILGRDKKLNSSRLCFNIHIDKHIAYSSRTWTLSHPNLLILDLMKVFPRKHASLPKYTF